MKRRLLKLAGLLLLGAVLNVAVAWGFAAWADLTTTLGTLSNPRQIDGGGLNNWQTYARIERVGASRQYWMTWPRIITQDGSIEREQATYMSSLSAEGTPEAADQHVIDRRGWPAKSLQCKFENTSKNRWQPMFEVRRGIKLPQKIGSDQRGLRAIPFMPIWPGFAVNTLFYAGVLWVLFAGPFALRRRSRAKRGLCVACAYDLRGSSTSTCPECGATVTPKALQQ